MRRRHEPCVLIEHENALVLEAQQETLEAAGFSVQTCTGPSAFPDGRCPLVTRSFCRKAEAADLVLSELPAGQLQVYVALRACFDDRPVLLGLSAAEQARMPTLTHLAEIVPRNLRGAKLVEAVHRAMSHVAVEAGPAADVAEGPRRKTV